MQFPLPAGGNGAGATPKGSQETAGALGRGLQFANAFTLLFTFLAYVIPIFGAWIADTRLGRYKTIAIGVLICGIAHVVIIFGALPSVLQAGHGIAPFMISYFILAFGAGNYLTSHIPHFNSPFYQVSSSQILRQLCLTNIRASGNSLRR
jgi:dipeptide/tripeptide permease